MSSYDLILISNIFEINLIGAEWIKYNDQAFDATVIWKY